ncbi:MAG: BrxA family protein [Bacillota bacterium]
MSFQKQANHFQDTTVYKCDLHRTGVFLFETRRLFEAFAIHGDFARLQQEALNKNLLGKTSTNTVKGMLGAFRRRFLQAHPPLPPAALVARAIISRLPELAKTQILFPYYIFSDALVNDVYRDLVLARLAGENGTLTREDLLAYLEESSKNHPELQKWAESTKIRWVRGMLSMLRAFGLLGHAPGATLYPFYLRPETFAFFWLWLRQQGFSFHEARSLELWVVLQVSDEGHFNDLFLAGQQQGWWQLMRSGEMVEFSTSFHSVEEWLGHAVERSKD